MIMLGDSIYGSVTGSKNVYLRFKVILQGGRIPILTVTVDFGNKFRSADIPLNRCTDIAIDFGKRTTRKTRVLANSTSRTGASQRLD